MPPANLDGLVHVTPEQIEAQASSLRTKASLIRQYLVTIDGRINELSPAVFEGQAATAFRQHYQQHRETMLTVPDRLQNYAERLESAAKAMRNADNQSAGHLPG